MRFSRKSMTPYFPVKRVVFMPPRTCHSVPLFLAAVCGGRERPLASAQWGRAFCGVAQAAPASLHNALRLGAAGVCLTSASVPDPRSPWAAPAGSPRHTSRWPRPPNAIEGLQVGAWQRQRGVQQEWLVKTRIMDERRAEGGRARLGIGADQV